jgi:hypothetical protein
VTGWWHGGDRKGLVTGKGMVTGKRMVAGKRMIPLWSNMKLWRTANDADVTNTWCNRWSGFPVTSWVIQGNKNRADAVLNSLINV